MKISSIFKDRLYSLPSQAFITAIEKKIIKRIVAYSKLDIEIDDLSLVFIEEDYDFYSIRHAGRFYDLKFSLDYKSDKFNREIKNIKNSKSISTSKYLHSGVVKVGDNISYLICESPFSESLFDFGRSELVRDLDSFCDSYQDFASKSNYRITYQTLIKQFLNDADMDSVFDQDQISYIENHSDYKKCKLIIDSLKSDISNSLNSLPKVYTGNIIGDFNKNSIFVSNPGFVFKDLRFGCKGHIYSDIANMVLFYGLNNKLEKTLLSKISTSLNLPLDQDLYNKFYQIELKRKALYYLLQYLKEVYVYESSRVEVIINIIDSFSQSYDRMCKIPIFKEHRRFILTNITEPILEHEPED